MRHLIIAEHGRFVGLQSERAIVKDASGVVQEAPLRTLRTIKIAKNGVSLSSDLILACAERGIKIFFTNFKGESTCFLSGTSQHAVAKVRRHQFERFQSDFAPQLAKTTLFAKIRNQRAVLSYFRKYQRKTNPESAKQLDYHIGALSEYAEQVNQVTLGSHWRENIMGIEGIAASTYFSAWPLLGMPMHFQRVTRGATDAVNVALNYGYAILQSHLWTAVTNAGLEPYVGFLHTDRPGKPSLVLDLMEEYRPWVVDRTVIKLMSRREIEFDFEIRKSLIREIERTLASKVPFKGKRLRLETIIQRRVYLLSGAIVTGSSRYSPMLFKW